MVVLSYPRPLRPFLRQAEEVFMPATHARVAGCALFVAAGLLSARQASGAVTEPNGLRVPIDSSPEVQLYTLFQSRGEAIDWQADAHTTPNTFSPLCGFTATYVLNQAGSHFGLAWYNDTGAAPQAADLHQLIAPSSPVGTTASGATIKADPAYAGGQVGFALVGGETHYSNASYDTTCLTCSPSAPWITALVYASTSTPQAYYLCFEDGQTTAVGWSNDGDFNDDVYFVTGITCSGGAVPCDTGKPGICGPGLTQCTATGTTCHQLSSPATKETCNGLDDDCNGLTDDGATCPPGQVCDRGACLKSCGGELLTCPPGWSCSNNGLCVDPACSGVSCPAGKVCQAGACKGPCDGVVCPRAQVCRAGACVEPCAGVTCGSGPVCAGGVCVTSCDCAPCAAGHSCDTKSGQCVEPACVGVRCAAGTACAGGKCVDACAGAVCPAGQACSTGRCAAVDGGAGGAGGLAVPDSGVFGGGYDGGVGPSGLNDGGSGDAGANAAVWGSGRASSRSGCGCVVAGPKASAGALAWLAVVAIIACARRVAGASNRARGVTGIGRESTGRRRSVRAP
jgi:hypothetical protein